MKVARYEVPGIGQKYGPVPEGRLKSGCALNYACRISRLPRIRRPSGTRPFFVCIQAINCLATIVKSLRDKKPTQLLLSPFTGQWGNFSPPTPPVTSDHSTRLFTGDFSGLRFSLLSHMHRGRFLTA